MNSGFVVALLNCFLLPALVAPAPTPDPALTFRTAVEQTRMVVEKILADVSTAHAATVTVPGLTLDPPSQSADLVMMRVKLDVHVAPVIKLVSKSFQLDTCVARMLAGTRLHQQLLGVLSDKLSGLQDLSDDLRDLLLRITKVREAGQLSGADGSEQSSSSDLAARLDGDYEVQVAAHLTLTQLRSFCHDMIRSLRHIEDTHSLALRSGAHG